jgi:arylsulfatase A-like enzyme
MTRRHNILLIVIDAVRADHLSCYGYPRPTTLGLEELAANGILFGRAFATAPWTPPSHASLFTGTYPSTHGVDVAENLSLPANKPTLAQVLADHGSRTFALKTSSSSEPTAPRSYTTSRPILVRPATFGTCTPSGPKNSAWS